MAIVLAGVTIRQPSNHGWIPPDIIGTGMDSDLIIPGIWGYQLEWELIEPDKLAEIQTIQAANQGSDMVASLPELYAATYANKDYVCRMNFISVGPFVNGHYSDVKTTLTSVDVTA